MFRLKIRFTDCEVPWSFASTLPYEKAIDDLWRIVDLITYNLKTELISQFPSLELANDNGITVIQVNSEQNDDVWNVLRDIITQLLQMVIKSWILNKTYTVLS